MMGRQQERGWRSGCAVHPQTAGQGRRRRSEWGRKGESEGRAAGMHICALCIDVGALGEKLVHEAKVASTAFTCGRMGGGPVILRALGRRGAAMGGR
jgi:hypothetical protein